MVPGIVIGIATLITLVTVFDTLEAAMTGLTPNIVTLVGFVRGGNANVYSWPAPGPAIVRTADAPYTTRVLVRKPAKDQHFSGNVVVEMLNPSNLFDLNIGWAMAREQIVSNGDAWVGITAKPISVEALKNFDAERYGSLSFANPLPLDDPQNCTAVAADSSRTTENGLVWDIYSQVGAWLKSDAPSNPLAYGGESTLVERAYGFGYSQTGGYLANYINGVQPHVVESDGAPIYDGYIVGVAGGAFAGAYPMNQCESAPGPEDPRRQFKDVGVPIMRLMSQSDYLRGIGSRRPDSDATGDQYRHYEMAGAGHATPDELYFSAASEDIVAAGRPLGSGWRCTATRRTDLGREWCRRARRIWQRAGGTSLSLPRCTDQHLVRNRHGCLLLLHSRI